MEVWNRHREAIEFLAVGHLAVDSWKGKRILGGAAAYGALTASRLGLRSAVVTSVGEDFDLFPALEGVEVWFHRTGASTAFENRYLDGHRRQRLLGRARPLTSEDLRPVLPRLAEDAISFYCPLARELQAPLVPLAPRGLSAAAPQGFFRQWDDEGWVWPAPWREAPSFVGSVDVLTLSESDPPDLGDFLRQVEGGVRLLAVTAATRPVTLYAEGRRYRIPVLARPEIDPTGAGDVFGAALLLGLREGQEPVEATRLACSAASFAVERTGVEGVPPSREAVEMRLAEYRKVYQQAPV